jgi:AcrR family transcriptional regulator
MGDDVKPRRRYRSERRREQAEQTRARVLDAAARLFGERGYERATIAAIAEEAGVSPETVYARFANKRTLLGELMQRAVRGPEPAPIPEQSGPRRLAAMTDQREQLRFFAADIVPRIERAGPMLAVLTSAQRTDPELAELYARLQSDRLRNLGLLADALAANGPLRLDRDEAVETVWAVASPELHGLLTQTRGWTRERYCDWLSETLAAVLLP